MTRAPLSVPCPRCAAVLPPGANFCRRCGIGLTRPPLPPSLQSGPLPTPQARRTSFTSTKPAKKSCSSTPLLPVLLVCVFALNALRAYQRNSGRITAPPPRVVSPRYFTPPTPLFAPGPQSPVQPAAPAHAMPTTPPYPGNRPASVDELHWSDTPRWSPHREARPDDPWHRAASPSRTR